MSRNGWRIGGPSPFFTERARERAPRIVDYAAAPGAAFVVSPAGNVVLCSGSMDDAEASKIAGAILARGDADGVRFLGLHGKWVYCSSVCAGWVLCVVTTTVTDAEATLDRTRRAGRVLAMALVDGGAPGESGGAGRAGHPQRCSPSCRAVVGDQPCSPSPRELRRAHGGRGEGNARRE